MLSGVRIITEWPLPDGKLFVFVCWASDLLLEWWCFTENVTGRCFLFEEQFLHFREDSSGLTDLLLKNSWCLFSLSSVLICRVSMSLVGLRQEVTLLRPLKCSRYSALTSAFWSNSLSAKCCTPPMVRASMATPLAVMLPQYCNYNELWNCFYTVYNTITAV